MPAMLIGMFMLLVASMASLSATAKLSAQSLFLSNLKAGQQQITREVSRYFLQTGSWPTSLSSLSQVAGFEHLKQYVPRSASGGMNNAFTPYNITVSSTLTSTSLQYTRVGVITFFDMAVPLATYLTSTYNTCNPTSSVAPFSTTTNWCGSSTQAYWSKIESQSLVPQQDATASKLQNITAAKLTRWYGTTPSFPITTAALKSLVAAAASNPSSTVGTSLRTCSGQFTWQKIGFECGDLYNFYGNPVTYTGSTAKKFTLTSNAQALSNTGATRVLTTTVTMP